MGLSLKPEYLKQYKDMAWLLMKYGRSELVQKAGLEEALTFDADEAVQKKAVETPEAGELAGDLERMGPTFVKLGQLLSTRSDLLPPAYLEALSRLQDEVEPFSFEEVEEIVSTELGVRMSKAFADFDSTPIAAASLGQVHRATMRNGRLVVVKVQRPGVREQVMRDLTILSETAEYLDNHTEIGRRYEFQNIMQGLRKSLLREMDYRLEAGHLTMLKENLREFDRIIVPAPVEDYSTSRVLTMDFIKGEKITEISPLRQMDIDGTALAEELFRAYLKQILIDGFFHADPHPGNIFLTDDSRLALLDLGMVARLTSGMQEMLLQLLLSISEGRGEDAAATAIKIGSPKENFDEAGFRRQVAELVAHYQGANLERINAGQVVLRITRLSADHGFSLPPEFTMIAKTLLNLDQVVETLDPSFNPNDLIRRHASDVLQSRLLHSLSPGNLFNALLEIKSFVEKLPNHINRVMQKVADGDFHVKVDAVDENILIEGFQKIANRITVGLLLAALIVGAALMMRVETSIHLFGYPALAIILFIIAAVGGFGLIINILFQDSKFGKRR